MFKLKFEIAVFLKIKLKYKQGCNPTVHCTRPHAGNVNNITCSAQRKPFSVEKRGSFVER
jgi:hypothetical protein